MRDDSQANTSLWMATANTSSQSLLKENIRTDVCIIGAGIAGLTTAYLLGREGRSAVVLDDGLIGGGMTGRTTAHLTNAYDDRYVEIEKLHGAEASRLTAESHTAAIQPSKPGTVRVTVHGSALKDKSTRVPQTPISRLLKNKTLR